MELREDGSYSYEWEREEANRRKNCVEGAGKHG